MVQFDSFLPEVRFIDQGRFSPSNNDANIQFETMNLKKVTVEIFQPKSHNDYASLLLNYNNNVL